MKSKKQILHLEKLRLFNTKKIKQLCEICGKIKYLPPSKLGRFCSKKCESIGKKGNKNSNWNSKKQKCIVCNKIFFRKLSEIKKGYNKFCSKKCEGKWRSKNIRGDKSSLWKGGISFEPYTTDWTETLKQSIRERDRYTCQLCHNSGNSIHHIDYVKKNCNPTNLITLCKKCNSKVNFNRNKWIKYFKEMK